MSKTLHDKREQMVNFLLENIVAREIERQNNDIVFSDSVGRNFFIRTLSRQLDFSYDSREDPRQFDNDRRILQAIYDEISFYIQRKNTEEYIPGFVLLQAETDFSQLKDRTEQLVNRGHFLKQKISPGKPDFDTRELDPIELALQQYYRHNSRNSSKRRGISGLTYFPELIYFNPKKGIIEVVSFANVSDPSRFKVDRCPSCQNPNGEEYDHQACKGTKTYLRHALQRQEARYTKHILISRQRKPRSSTSKKEAERGLKFMPAELDSTKLTLPSEQYLAVVK